MFFKECVPNLSISSVEIFLPFRDREDNANQLGNIAKALMETTYKKLKLVYFPILLISTSFILLYTFIDWFFFIRSNVFFIKEEVLEFIVPILLSAILSIILLKYKFKLLTLKKGSKDWSGLYFFLLFLPIFALTTISQSYLRTSTGRLTLLENINQIGQNKVDWIKKQRIKYLRSF